MNAVGQRESSLCSIVWYKGVGLSTRLQRFKLTMKGKRSVLDMVNWKREAEKVELLGYRSIVVDLLLCESVFCTADFDEGMYWSPLLLAWYINNPRFYTDQSPNRDDNECHTREYINCDSEKNPIVYVLTSAIRYSHLRMQNNSADWLEAAILMTETQHNIKEEGVQFNRTAVKLKWIALTKERGARLYFECQ